MFETGDNRRIAVKFKSQRIGDCFPSQVVFGRAESAHEDDDLGTRHGETGCSRETLAAIPDDGLEDHFNPKLIELFGQIKRVRVLTERSQQLRPNGDDLGVHE